MKLLLLFASSAISIFPLNSATLRAQRAAVDHTCTTIIVPAMNTSNTLSLGDPGGPFKIPVATFKDQQFCRAESGDFNLDTKSSIIGATVYFYGKGFHAVAKGILPGSSLQPIAELMKRCKAGTVVAFDEIKVLGPDHRVHSMEGESYLLY